MGKKSAHTGMSPKDRSMNIMDKFIKKNSAKTAHEALLPARRKSADVPLNLWPFEDQVAYYENRTDGDRFVDEFRNYADWFNAVKSKSNVYPATFISYVSNKKEIMQKMYADKLWPKEAVRELQKLGVY
jgi:hypothetical protein